MVNGKCRQGEPITTIDLTLSNHSTYTTSPKCLTSMSTKSTKSTSTTAITSKGQSTVLPPHRKVFMITEKSGENDEQYGPTDGTNARRKRKMILIMDEKPRTETTVSTIQCPNRTKHIRTDKDHAVKSTTTTTTTNNGAPKLLFFANSVDDHLSQKIEEILPEILSRIQWKNGRVADGNDIKDGKDGKDGKESSNMSKQQRELQHTNTNSNNGYDSVNRHTKKPRTCETSQNVQGLLHEEYSNGGNAEHAPTTLKKSEYVSTHHSNNANLMLLGAAAAATVANHTTETTRRITLPPKKNHSKFQRQLNNNNYNSNNNNNNFGGPHIISAATPVIVSAISLNKASNQVSAIRTSTDISNNINIINNNNSNSQQHQQQNNKIHQLNGNGQLQSQHQHQQQQHYPNIYHHNSNQDNKHHNYNHSNKNCNNNNNNNNSNNNININNNNNDNDKTTNGEKRESSIVVQQQNINLTGDFLFLMKMLPMLEKTPEPRKSQVKMLIEKIMKQCVAGDNTQ